MLSFGKILLLVLVVIAIGVGFRIFGAVGGRARPPRRVAPRGPRMQRDADAKVEDLQKCVACGAFVSPRLGPCGRAGCPR